MLLGQNVGVELLPQCHEGSEGGRANQAADALREQKDDDEAQDVARAFRECRRETAGHGPAQEKGRAGRRPAPGSLHLFPDA